MDTCVRFGPLAKESHVIYSGQGNSAFVRYLVDAKNVTYDGFQMATIVAICQQCKSVTSDTFGAPAVT